MAEIVLSKKQDRAPITERFKKQPVANEGSDGMGILKQDDFFERVSLLQYFVVVFGLVSFEVLCFQTDICPFEQLGGVGRRLQYLTSNHLGKMRFLFLFTVVLHVFEAIYAHYQCRKIRINDSATQKWMVQTFIIGYGSLRILNEYCEKKARRKTH